MIFLIKQNLIIILIYYVIIIILLIIEIRRYETENNGNDIPPLF